MSDISYRRYGVNPYMSEQLTHTSGGIYPGHVNCSYLAHELIKLLPTLSSNDLIGIRGFILELAPLTLPEEVNKKKNLKNVISYFYKR